MKYRIRHWATASFALCLAFCPLAPAREANNELSAQLSKIFDSPNADKPFETESVRYVPGADKALVQVPCYRFVDGEGRKLEFTGAIHIADKAYYEGLNVHFKEFDTVLFELVADPEQIEAVRKLAPGAPTPDLAKETPLSKMYRVMAHDLLGISLQSEIVDYKPANFVHADLSGKELEAMLKGRGISLDDLLMKKMKEGGLNLSIDQVAGLLPLLKVFIPKDDPKALQRMMAPMMARMEDAQGNAEDKVFNEIIVLRRNERALQELDKQLAAGKKNLSIFYGSAHFPDMKKRLLAKGWKQTGVEWRDAWAIPAKNVKADDAASVTREQPTPAVETPVSAEAAEALTDALRPLVDAKASHFTCTTNIHVEVMGQVQDKDSTFEIQASQPNKFLLRIKSAGQSVKLIQSDGTNLTLMTDGEKTYKQLSAPPTFEAIAKLPELAPGDGDEFAFSPAMMLQLLTTGFVEQSGIVPTKVLEPADLKGRLCDRIQGTIDGVKAIVWLDRKARFPLARIEIDSTSLIDKAVEQAGPDAAMLKGLMKVEANITFTGDLDESLPEETFRFAAPEGATKE